MTDPVSRAARHLHLAADTYEPGHPYEQALRDVADALNHDGNACYEAHRTAVALLHGVLMSPPLDPLPEPDDEITGAEAEQLPPGSVVYRTDLAEWAAHRTCVAPGRYAPEIDKGSKYRVRFIPTQRDVTTPGRGTA